jgi:hypothetical protein
MVQHDPFSKLPSPILLLIIKLSSDLSSFRDLDKASPTIASLFDECGPEIIEAIMTTSLPEQIRNLIRAVVAVRCGSVTSRSLDAFIETYLGCERVCKMFLHIAGLRSTNPASDNSPETCSRCAIKPPAFRIPSSTPRLVLRGILDLAHQIQRLIDFCLKTMIVVACLLNHLTYLIRSSDIYPDRDSTGVLSGDH